MVNKSPKDAVVGPGRGLTRPNGSKLEENFPAISGKSRLVNIQFGQINIRHLENEALITISVPTFLFARTVCHGFSRCLFLPGDHELYWLLR